MPQSSCPIGQIVWHIPATHDCPAPQRLPQRPQLLVSVVGSMHVPPHKILGAVQVVLTHMPIEQRSPGAQARPHAPQLRTSV
jgi:hypothetical protein